MINLASLLIFSLVLRRYVMLKGKKVCSVSMDAFKMECSFQLKYLTPLNIFISVYGSDHQNYSNRLADRALRDANVRNRGNEGVESRKNDPTNCLYHMPDKDMSEIEDDGLCLPYSVILGTVVLLEKKGRTGKFYFEK